MGRVNKTLSYRLTEDFKDQLPYNWKVRVEAGIGDSPTLNYVFLTRKTHFLGVFYQGKVNTTGALAWAKDYPDHCAQVQSLIREHADE